MRLKLTYAVLLFFLSLPFAFAQEKTVTGVVKDDSGQPLPGAAVVVKGTTVGVETDFDGNYKISAKQGETLRFTYVGMKTVEKKVPAGAQNVVINVVLEHDAQELEGVVVTAMGITRSEKSLGYATQKINSEELNQGSNSNVATALQGKVSGVEITSSSGMPGASSRITIRGARSFTGNNQPLYVVDGMPITSVPTLSTLSSIKGADYASRALDIDPNDIEDLQVLKGQAASALYGMRASNGVILITTKSGKGKAGKPQITINSNVSFDTASVYPDLQTEYAQGSGGNYLPSTSLSWGPKISELANDPKYGGNTDNEYTKQYGKQPGKYYVPQRFDAGQDPWQTPQVYDNVRDFFRVGYNINNSVNIAQAFGSGNYSLSLGNTETEGIVPSTNMGRTTAKLGAEINMNTNWASGFTGNYVVSKLSKQTSANDGIVATVYPSPASFDLKGIPSHKKGLPYVQNNYRGGSFDQPYWAANNNEFTEKTTRFFGNAFVKYNTKFNTDTHSLTVKYQLGTDTFTTHYKDAFGYGHSGRNGEIEEYVYTIKQVNSLLTATYNWKINDNFTFDALLGNEFINETTDHTYAQGKDFLSPGWTHLRNTSVQTSDATFAEERTVGFFGNMNISYRDIVFLGVTGRQDVVSTMPRDHRTFFYPSTSLGVVLSEIPALKNDVLTFAKLRASYAEVGQAGSYKETFYRTPIYEGGFSVGNPIMYPINGVSAFTQYFKVYDPELRPQNTISYEAGVDLAFWHGLIDLSYTYSRQNVKDQIFDVPLAGSTGARYLITNGGRVHTDAHEATLTVKPVNKQNVKWDVSLNFSKIDNYVDELAPGVESIFLGGFIEPQIRAGIGYKFPVIYGTSFKRSPEGKVVVDDDGFPIQGEEKVIGSVSPDFRLGFGSSVELYKFRLSALFEWKQGGQIYGGTKGIMNLYGRSQYSADLRNSVSFQPDFDTVKMVTDASGNVTYAPNDIQIPGAYAMDYFFTLNGISESSVYDTSFVKLREVSLSYPLVKQPWLTVDANLFARNIIVWSALKDYDPEISQGNNNMAGGFERFSLPGTSSYGLGFNIKF